MDKLLEWLEKYFYTFWGLLLGNLLIILILLLPLNQFLDDLIKNSYIRIPIYILLLMIFTIIWIYLRYKLPVNKGKKIGIFIIIETENIKQKTRIAKDVTQGIAELLSKENLLSLFNIIVPNDHQTKRIVSFIKSFKKERNKWDKMTKKINAHLFIYGEIIERLDLEKKYIIKFDGIITKHRTVDTEASKKFKEILLLFPKEFSFYEKLELKGFKITSDLLYIVIRYQVGIAAFLSGDVNTAHLLHKELNEQVKKIMPYNPFLNNISNNLKEWRGTELQLLSKYAYFIEKDKSKTIKLITEAGNILPDNYHILVFKSYLAFDIERNSIKALRLLEKSRRFSKGNYVWLYNRAFILMYDGNYKKGFEEYESLESINFLGENIVVNECISYDKAIYEKEPQKKQFLFTIAFLYFKKIKNYPIALEYFESFLKEADNQEYEFLINKSKEFILIIKKEMEQMELNE